MKMQDAHQRRVIATRERTRAVDEGFQAAFIGRFRAVRRRDHVAIDQAPSDRCRQVFLDRHVDRKAVIHAR